MSDFSARFTAGTTLATWDDPATASLPSRINPVTNRRHLRAVGTVGTEVTVTATFEGVDGPLDAALGGRLFFAWFPEAAGATPITSPAGQSSVQRFTPAFPGHYTFALCHEDGGGILIMHLDVQEP